MSNSDAGAVRTSGDSVVVDVVVVVAVVVIVVDGSAVVVEWAYSFTSSTKFSINKIH